MSAAPVGAVGLAGVLAAVAAGCPPPADGSVRVLPRAAGGAVAAVLGFTAHHVVAADVPPEWVRSVLPAGSLSAPLAARFLAALADRVGAEPGAPDAVLVAPAAGVPLPGPAPAAGLAVPGSGPGVGGSPGPGAARGGSRRGPGVPGRLPPRAWRCRVRLRRGPGAARAGSRRGLAVPGQAPAAGLALPGLARVAAAEHPRVARAERYRVDVRAYQVPGGLLVLGRGLAGRWEVAVEVDPAYRGRGLGRRLAAAAPGLVPPGEPLWAQVAPANVASVRAFLAAGYRVVGAEVLLA